jgi:hypothetical protein
MDYFKRFTKSRQSYLKLVSTGEIIDFAIIVTLLDINKDIIKSIKQNPDLLVIDEDVRRASAYNKANS